MADGQGPLGKRSLFGMIWSLGATGGGRAAGLLAQLLLARLLSPEDFGVFGQAMGIGAIAMIFQFAGLQDVLVQRGESFARYAKTAFRLAVVIGVLSAGALCALAYPSAHLIGEAGIVPLLFAFAGAIVINAFATVPLARLKVDLRFRAISLMELSIVASTWTLTVLFAWAGLGAMSFALPYPIVAIGRVVTVYALAGRGASGGVAQPGDAVSLMRDAWKSLVSALVHTLTLHAASFLLGLRFASETIGLFVFAFGLSLQMLMPLTIAFSSVLMPVLSKLQGDPVRLHDAWRKTTSSLVVVGALPLVFVAWRAGEVVPILFGDQWDRAAFILSVMCAGLLMRLPNVTSSVLLRATGRFTLLMGLNVGFAVVYLASLGVAMSSGSIESVAVVASVVIGLFGPATAFAALRGSRGVLAGVAWVWAQQLGFALVAVGIGRYGLGAAIALDGWIALVAHVAIVCVVYLALTWAFRRSLIVNILDTIRRRSAPAELSESGDRDA